VLPDWGEASRPGGREHMGREAMWRPSVENTICCTIPHCAVQGVGTDKIKV
jgi:hypothetical protein